MSIEYTYRYRKIIAKADDITVIALLKHITGQCQSPMDIDPRKGVVIHWHADEGQSDHSELAIKQADFSKYSHWLKALRNHNAHVLAVNGFVRHDEDGESRRYVVADSRDAYSTEDKILTAAWIPTKAFKANSMCFKNIAKPNSALEKRDDLILQVNMLLANYSDWVNGENYSLTVNASEAGKPERVLIENMFLGSGYNLCSEIARSHISVVLRKMENAKFYHPEVDAIEEVANEADSKVTFLSDIDN